MPLILQTDLKNMVPLSNVFSKNQRRDEIEVNHVALAIWSENLLRQLSEDVDAVESCLRFAALQGS